MRLLQVRQPRALSVLLFGLGLIGGAVDRALRLRFQAGARDFPYDWHDPDLRAAQRRAIAAALPADGRVAVVWTGGQYGFGSTAAEMQRETALIAELIGMAGALGRDRPVDFHLTSSAGGLFESQTHCTRSSTPRPLRPYGAGKLQQEHLLAAAAGLASRSVYRPSSVYGVSRSRRIGLVTALISNAITGRTTRISGDPNTLRDYVLSDDIGQFVAGRIVAPQPAAAEPRTFLMASGRPATVFEVIERVRAGLDRPLLLQFDPHPANTRDMSFRPSALPGGWRPTPLSCGISRIVARCRSGLA